MTIGEFLAPLAKKPLKERVLAAMYFSVVHENGNVFSSSDVRQLLKRARDPKAKKANIASMLDSLGSLIECVGKTRTGNVWRITDSGTTHVREVLGLPEFSLEAAHEIADLTAHVNKIKNGVAREFLAEGVDCLRFDALRAAVVFIWAGAMRVLQETLLLKKYAPNLNAAIQKHYTKARNVSVIDDFAYIREEIVLLTAQELHIIDKSEHGRLKTALDLRNNCGHPAKYKPKLNAVKAFVEDVVGIIF